MRTSPPQRSVCLLVKVLAPAPAPPALSWEETGLGFGFPPFLPSMLLWAWLSVQGLVLPIPKEGLVSRGVCSSIPSWAIWMIWERWLGCALALLLMSGQKVKSTDYRGTACDCLDKIRISPEEKRGGRSPPPRGDVSREVKAQTSYGSGRVQKMTQHWV